MTRLNIIVRFKDEATYLEAVLRAIREQRCLHQVEIVAIDNASTDNSAEIAARYADVLLDISEYRPGAALNQAISSCNGDALVILSAHAIPANRSWLENLTAWLPNQDVLGTYGAQLYPVTSRFLDKRDLDIFSGLRPRTETRDSDFWNANSAFLRSFWEKEQFDSSVIELEDHHWTKKLLPQGNTWVRFEPTALVYHYGHEARNDRTYLPPSPLSDEERIEAAVAVLESPDEQWPAVMSAGLTLGSLSHGPGVERAVPALGAVLLGHEDFDVRWRVAGALGRIGTPLAAHFLVQGLRDHSFYARDEAAWALARLGLVGAAELMPALGNLDAESLPFAGLALGLCGDESAALHGVEVLGNGLMSDSIPVVRDSLYFLGEIAGLPAAAGLMNAVTASLRSEDDEVSRAAAWCWGTLAARAARDDGLNEHEVVDLARHHPLETVRFEAVISLGKAAIARPPYPLSREVARALRYDGSGRVRYGSMQSIRLMIAAGFDGIPVALAHEYDTDFGVMFERQLILGAAS
jgi:HEAT repeat protein